MTEVSVVVDPTNDVAVVAASSSGSVVAGPSSVVAHTHPATDINDSTAAGRALLTAADAAAQRTAIGLDTAVNQTFTASGTGAVSRSVDGKLKDIVSVKDFGAVGDGSTNDTAAFNAAITWANSKGGNDRANIVGSNIFIPSGRYLITAALSAITVSSVMFVGAGEGASVLLLPPTVSAFTFKGTPGSVVVVGGGIRDVKIEYTSDPSGGGCVATVDYAFQLSFSNILLERSATLLYLGVTSSRIAGAVSVSNVCGSISNVGISLFNVRHGAGLYVDNCQVFVRGVPTPTHPSSMTTVYGTNAINCGAGSWDTIQVSNCIFERFDIGFSAEVGASTVVQNAFFDNVIFDYCRRFAYYLNANGSGSVISSIRVGSTCWFNSWETSSIYMKNVSGYVDNCSFSGFGAISGQYSVYYEIGNAYSNSFVDMVVNGANRLGTVSSCLQFQPNSTGFTVSNVKGNNDASIAWTRPNYGVVVSADCDRYTVSNCAFYGPTAGYSFAANSAGSKNRRAVNNINASYAGSLSTSVPASTVTYTNTTPFIEEWQLFGGTITTGYDKNGVGFPGALSYLTFRLQPGETFAVGYSVAPTAKKSVEP